MQSARCSPTQRAGLRGASRLSHAKRLTCCLELEMCAAGRNMRHYTAICCNMLQYTAIHCIVWSMTRDVCVRPCRLQYTAIHCNTLQYIAIHCNTLQYTAIHCNILQYTALHCTACLTSPFRTFQPINCRRSAAAAAAAAAGPRQPISPISTISPMFRRRNILRPPKCRGCKHGFSPPSCFC